MPSLADPDKTLAVGDLLGNRVTAGATVHRNFGRELGRSKALLWHALFVLSPIRAGSMPLVLPVARSWLRCVSMASRRLFQVVTGKASPHNEFVQQLLK